MVRRRNMNNFSSVTIQNDETEQHPESDDRNHKQVDGGNAVAWFRKKVSHPCDGGCLPRTMYFATVDCETSSPILSSSPWIRGAPHIGLAILIFRISRLTSPSTRGRPTLPRDLCFQKSRNPAHRTSPWAIAQPSRDARLRSSEGHLAERDKGPKIATDPNG